MRGYKYFGVRVLCAVGFNDGSVIMATANPLLDGKKIKNLQMPLFGELSQTSQDLFESDSDSHKSRDVRLNSPKSGVFYFLPLLGELSRTSRESFESESDSKDSRDVRLNSPKSGIFYFLCFSSLVLSHVCSRSHNCL